MNRYEVEVKVTYRITAPSYTEAYRLISQGAEFPIAPWNDENYVADITIAHITELSHADIPANS